MKFCRNCGKELNDNAKFCGGCGAATPVREAAPAPVMGVAPAPANYSAAPLLTNNNVSVAVKKCAASPLFLVSIIVFTVATLFGLINLFDSANTFSSIGVRYSDEAMASMSSLSAIPSVLMIIGMWITYFSAVGSNSKISTAGLSIIKVISVISLVFICIGAGLVSIGFIIIALFMNTNELRREMDWDDILPRGSYNDVEEILAIASVIAFMIIVAVLVLAIIYYSKIVGTINTIKSTIETEKVTGKASGFVAVMSIIFGAISAISALAYLGEGYGLAGFTALLSALSPILFGALLFSYNKRISQF